MTKILLVDDSIFTLNLYSDILTGMGYEVFTAENGEEAISIFKNNSPNIVLCDLMMPEMDGFEVIKSIKEINPDTVFYFVTADIQESKKNKAIELGASGIINKPLTEALLKEVLEQNGK